MITWLIGTDDGGTHTLTYSRVEKFTLFIDEHMVSPRFGNVGEVKDALRDFGLNAKEFLQVEGEMSWPIKG